MTPLQLMDQILTLESSNRQSNNQYPHYNLRKIDETKVAIDLALAGIPINEIDVELNNQILTVSYTASDDPNTYVYKGISKKSFNRQFKLHPNMVVLNASTDNGILTILLERIVPDELKPKKIPIITKQVSNKQFLTENR